MDRAITKRNRAAITLKEINYFLVDPREATRRTAGANTTRKVTSDLSALLSSFLDFILHLSSCLGRILRERPLMRI